MAPHRAIGKANALDAIVAVVERAINGDAIIRAGNPQNKAVAVARLFDNDIGRGNRRIVFDDIGGRPAPAIIRHHVLAVAAAKAIDVIAVVAAQEVVAGAASQYVVAAVGGDRVVAAAA